ncbi:Ankyrin repeat and BTB/POZ domain-containing protein 1 [Galdieria sulphuraria]|uniref:BTB domain-containing protein n=1 Tax=Galdieria sulphuraria TaxID=130081 RepID=M2WS05_GALSU|nr:uncharacterized protein Gasu_57410 [Galdieria sulphuraria]EME26620.1 hypothetical protein Gasu_57410 [Galdieria sulphuraria]GJD08718.1 Ankyrin repeat and BTB/POZ domain-containing protein 1 [Galdieria sulphuraria]|eukprot:XP_005703140.1 hypothetical protein Gasu_57410 [Galdieria sulphuraria]
MSGVMVSSDIAPDDLEFRKLLEFDVDDFWENQETESERSSLDENEYDEETSIYTYASLQALLRKQGLVPSDVDTVNWTVKGQTIFQLCRIGDIESVQALVQKGVELNVRDAWDATPLYYSCLCGHVGLVRYLLEQGAVCDVDTFDGERCYYAALNKDIRDTLLAFRGQVLPRGEDQFSGYLRRVFESLQQWGEDSDADIYFEIFGNQVYAHRIVLATRCPYFEELIQKRWRFKRRIKLKHPLLSFRAFYALVKYLYTASLDLSEEDTSAFLALCRQCRLEGLQKAILRELNIAEAKREMKHRVLAKITAGGGDSLRILIYGNKHLNSLHEDFSKLGLKLLDVSKEFSEFDGDMESCLEWFHACPGNLYADVILKVQQRFLFCHRFVLMRSEYFKGLQSFRKDYNTDMSSYEAWTLDELDPFILSHVLYYLYCERLFIGNELSTQMVVDILDAGEMLLVPGIKESCASLLIQNLSCENAVSLLEIAETFSLSSLRAACCLIIAADFWDLVRPSKEGDEFTDLLSRLEPYAARSIVEDVRESAVALGGSEDRTFDEREELGERLDAVFELLGFTDLA